MQKLLPAVAVCLVMTACDSIATWTKDAAKEDLRRQLGPNVRLSGVRYVRKIDDLLVCGRADGRRFTWRGDYQSGKGETLFFGQADAARWEAACSVRSTPSRGVKLTALKGWPEANFINVRFESEADASDGLHDVRS